MTRATGNEILADYGKACSFMLFLYDRYGIGFMSALHRDGDGQGLVGLQDALDGYAAGPDVYDVLHDFQISTLVDKYVDTGQGHRHRDREGRGSRRRASTRRSTWATRRRTPQPGAPANGADYVGLRARQRAYLKGKDLEVTVVRGRQDLVPEPLKWTA